MPDTSRANAEVTVRLATLADGPRCNAFHNTYYKHNRTIAQWMWEFANEVERDGTIPFAIAESNGEVVGTQALIKIDMIDGCKVFRTAKSEETLISPSMRGRNLFARMYEPLFEYAKDTEIRAIWGFTPAGIAFQKVGFEVPGETSQIMRAFSSDAAATLLPAVKQNQFRKLAYRVGGGALAAYSALASWLNDAGRHPVEFKFLHRSPEWATTLSDKFIAQWGGCTIHRSTPYLQWRVFSNPYCHPYFVAAFYSNQPVGFVCFAISKQKVASIVDIVAIDVVGCAAQTTTLALLSFAAAYSRSLGAVAIRGWSVTTHPFDALVCAAGRKLGWIKLRHGFNVIFKELNVSGASPPPFTEWYVSRIFTEGVLG